MNTTKAIVVVVVVFFVFLGSQAMRNSISDRQADGRRDGGFRSLESNSRVSIAMVAAMVAVTVEVEVVVVVMVVAERSFPCTWAGELPGGRAVARLDEHLLPAGLDHVHVLAHLLEGHLQPQGQSNKAHGNLAPFGHSTPPGVSVISHREPFHNCHVTTV